MTFLPYGGGSATGWLAAGGVSALAHGAMVLAAVSGLAQFDFAPPAEREQPRVSITLEQFDAGAVVPPTTETASDAPEAEVPADVPIEELAALPPEATPEPESLAPEPAAPEPLAPEPAAPEPVAPETAAPPESALPVVPEAAAPVPLGDAAPTLDPDAAVSAADPAVPVLPESGAVPVPPLPAAQPSPILSESPLVSATGEGGIVPDAVPVEPVLQPSATVASSAESGLPQVAPAPVTAVAQPALPVTAPSETRLVGVGPVPDATVAIVPETVTVAATPPPAAPRPPPSPQDRLLADLIDRVRAMAVEPCLVALPRRDGAEAVGLALFSASEAATADFVGRLLGPEDGAMRQTRTLVDPRQCAALDLVASHPDYPASALGISLEQTVVPSGDSLRGAVRGAARGTLTLLLVDNNGVVQDLQRFAAFSSGSARVDVPVTLDGSARDTAQLLIALVTPRPPVALVSRDGRLADEVFSDLPAEEAPIALGMVSFDLR